MTDLHAATYQGPCACPTAIGAVLLALDPCADDAAAALPGLAGLLDHLGAAGIPCLVATPMTRAQVARRLDATACAHRLTMRLCREDMAETFPDPAGLLLAAQRLALPASHVVVIADGPAGLAAARSAGCVAIALTTGGTTAPPSVSLPGIARLDVPLPLMPWIENHLCCRQDRVAAPLVAMGRGGR